MWEIWKAKPLHHESASILHQKPVYLATLIKSGPYAELGPAALWFIGAALHVCYKAMLTPGLCSQVWALRPGSILHQLSEPERVIEPHFINCRGEDNSSCDSKGTGIPYCPWHVLTLNECSFPSPSYDSAVPIISLHLVQIFYKYNHVIYQDVPWFPSLHFLNFVY